MTIPHCSQHWFGDLKSSPMRQQLCYVWVCAAEGDLASDSVLAGGLRVTHEYDLTQKDKIDEYWARLEYATLSK